MSFVFFAENMVSKQGAEKVIRTKQRLKEPIDYPIGIPGGTFCRSLDLRMTLFCASRIGSSDNGLPSVAGVKPIDFYNL